MLQKNIRAAESPNTPIGPIPSPYTATLISVLVVFLALAIAAVALRIYAARVSSKSMWLTTDLIIILAALAVSFGSILASIIGAGVVGIGTIGHKLSLPDAAQFAFKVYFSDVITTTAASGLCKISILEFYKRIFVTRSFRWTCNVVVFLVSAWMIGTFFTQLFSTTPISSGWHPDRQILDANYNYPTAILAILGIGMVLDVLVLCLPLHPISRLQLKWQSKLKIALILWLGIFCVICASVRFYYGYKSIYTVFRATAQEKATITTNAAMWLKMEPTASIVAACLPTYGSLVKNLNLSLEFQRLSSLLTSRSSNGNSTGFPTPLESESEGEMGSQSSIWSRFHSRGRAASNETSPSSEMPRPEDNEIRATYVITVTNDEKGEPQKTI